MALRPLHLAATAVVAAAFITTVAPRAEAQEWTPRTQGSRVGVDFDGSPATDYTTLSWGIIAQIRLTEHFYIDAELPFGYATADRNPTGTFAVNSSAFVFGNPYVGVHYASYINHDLAFFVGGGLNVPTILNPDAKAIQAADALTVTRAGYDSERFAVETFTVKGRFGLEARIAPHFYYRGEIAPVLLFHFGENNSFVYVQNHAYFFPEMANELEVRADVGFGGGLRLTQQLFFGPQFGADRYAAAAEPFMAYEPRGSGFDFRLGLLVAMNDPYGFGFDTDKVATLRVSMGGKW